MVDFCNKCGFDVYDCQCEEIAKTIIKREAEVEKKVINDAGEIILSVG